MKPRHFDRIEINGVWFQWLLPYRTNMVREPKAWIRVGTPLTEVEYLSDPGGRQARLNQEVVAAGVPSDLEQEMVMAVWRARNDA